MDALELLSHDHRELKALLEKAVEESRPERRDAMLATIRGELAAHELMEERLLYPRLRGEDDARDAVLEGYEEHHVADVLLDELMEVSSSGDQWKAKITVLKENLEHHIEEEEGEMFEAARRALGASELDDLGRRMAAFKSGA